jgi:hypothetical protein
MKMGLTNAEVQKLVKEKPRRKAIETGKGHQNRLKFHTETAVSKASLSPYYDEFVHWIGSENPVLLPKDKIDRFIQLLTVPLGTIELTEDIFTNINKIFSAQDRLLKYSFNDSALEDDWNAYRDEMFWKTHGFQAMMNEIDSVWVVDLPSKQNTPRPQPKDRLINIRDIIDIDCDSDNVCKHVIFQIGDLGYCYDDEKFMVYGVEKNEFTKTPLIERAHNLGYTPARMFWTDKLQSGNNINKRAPLTNSLSDLDWYLTHLVFKKYMDIANSFPIVAAYRQQDDFQGGPDQDGTVSEGKKPKMGGNLMGPGTILTVDPPLSGEPDAMSNPIKLINPDISTLEFHVTESDRLRQRIFQSIVGSGGEPKNDVAKNEKQVMSSFETQTAALRRVAHNFEQIHKFADKCKIDIMYGPNAIEDITVSYGQKFFLKTVSDLTVELSESKKNGSHSSVVDSIIDEINETKFKDDTRGMSRMKIIRDLDPLPEKTIDEAILIYDKGGLSTRDFVIKSYLMNFIRRFEREQAPLVDFASKRSYDIKISSIFDELKKYADEKMAEDMPEENPAPVI